MSAVGKEDHEVVSVLRALRCKVKSYQQSFADNREAALARKERCQTDRDAEREESWVQHWDVKLSANCAVDKMLAQLIEDKLCQMDQNQPLIG